MSDNAPILTFEGHSDYIFSLAFSPDGTYLASASRDKTVRIWRVSTGETIDIYTRHSGYLLSVAWSPDGRYLASGDTDGVVHVWEAFPSRTILTYGGHTRFVRSVSWSPDGRYLASSGDFGDSTAQVWEAMTGQHVYTHSGQYRVFVVGWSPSVQELSVCLIWVMQGQSTRLAGRRMDAILLRQARMERCGYGTAQTEKR